MVAKHVKSIVITLGLSLLLATPVLAEEKVKTVGTYTGKENVSVYVKGLDVENTDVECQIGTKAEQTITYEAVEEMENPLKTLILVDNSLSITEANRSKINDFLLELVDDKQNAELIAINTFSTQLTEVIGYTADKKALNAAIQSITYQNQDTYFTDILYEVLKNDYLGTEDSYKRIIIISDGVDDKSIGYTKDELITLVQKKDYPIYTIGCKYNNNNEKLENMYSISRLTDALDFTMDDEQDMDALVDKFTADNNIIHFLVYPDKDVMDGSDKNILITVKSASGEYQIETAVKMPFATIEKETETIVLTQGYEEEEEDEESKDEVETEKFPISYMYIGIAAIALGGGAIALILIFTKLKKKSTAFETLDDLNASLNEIASTQEKTTVLLGNENEDSGEKTQLIWGNSVQQYNLCLTDIKNPGKTFRVPLNGTVIIGRKAGAADLVIDYEKSVSSRHCQISVRNGKFYVQDLQSANGTLLNGTKILCEMEIHSGCVLTLGRVEMRVEIR